MVTITECTEVTDELVDAMNRLISQLSSSNPPPSRAELREIVASPATTLLLARGRPDGQSHRGTAGDGQSRKHNAADSSPGSHARDTPSVIGSSAGAADSSPRSHVRDTHSVTGSSAGADDIIGTLTLVVFRIPTGVRARIEDVVVDETARGRRVGERLSFAALDKAKALGATSADLTSRPSRQAANRLYRRMGFEQRESNVYRFKL